MRAVKVTISPKIFARMFQQGQTAFCQKGIPAGASVLGVSLDLTKDEYTIVFRHDSFDDVPSSGEIPEINILFCPVVQNRAFR